LVNARKMLNAYQLCGPKSLFHLVVYEKLMDAMAAFLWSRLSKIAENLRRARTESLIIPYSS